MNKQKFLTSGLIVALFAFISCALWGSAFPCVKIGYKMLDIGAEDTSSQILFAGIRFTIAGIMVILFSSFRERHLVAPSKKEIPKVMALSFFQTILQYLLFYIGLAHTSGVKASVIIGSNVFVAIMISSLVFRREKLTLRKIAGCAAGFAGIVIINIPDGGFDRNFTLTGEGFMFISTFSYAFSSVLMKKYSVSSNPVMMSGWQFLFGGAVMALSGAVSGGVFAPESVSAVVMLLYLAFISAAAYSLWAMLLQYNPVSRVSVYGFINPVIGVILSAVLLKEGESLGYRAVIALLLVCAGIFIVNGRIKQNKKAEAGSTE